MRKRIVATFLSLLIILSVLPFSAFAATTFTFTVQPVIVDGDGKLMWGQSFESKNFSGTTAGGYTSPETTWQWTPSGANYSVSGEANTNVNAAAHLKYPTELWEYDSTEYKFIGMGSLIYSTTLDYNLTEAQLTYAWQFENLSFSVTNRTGKYFTYIFQQQGSSTPTTPAITGFEKERLLEEPAGLDLTDEISYDSEISIPSGGSVTLLYQLTVNGTAGKPFTVTDTGAKLVGSNCNAAQVSQGASITGEIPTGGTAILYVTKSFTSNDVANGKVSNTASVDTSDAGGVADGEGDSTEETPATITYTLTYDANGGSGAPAPVEVAANTYYPLHDAGPTTAPQHDKTLLFEGWTLDDTKLDILTKDTAEDDIPQISERVYMDQAHTVYAVWAEDANGNGMADYKEIPITVTFNAAPGTAEGTTEYTLQPFSTTEYQAPAVTAPEGQQFTQWQQRGGTNTLADQAYFTYDSIFAMTGGTASAVIFDAQYDNLPPAAADPTVDELNNLIDVFVQCQAVASEHSSTFASLLENSYRVTGAGDTRTVTILAEPYVAALSNQCGVAHQNSGSTSAAVELVYDGGWKIAQGSSGTVTFQATCDFQLIYHGNGGLTADNKDTVSYSVRYGSTAAIQSSMFTREGYVFEGWALSENGNVVYQGSEEIPFTEAAFPNLLTDGKVDLYAVWTADTPVAHRTVEVTFTVNPAYGFFTKHGEGPVIFANIDEFSTQQYEVPAVTAKEGYKFVGWKVRGADVIAWGADVSTFSVAGLCYFPEGSNVGYASIEAVFEKVTPETYTVTLVGEGRNAYGEGSYKAGETVTIYAGTKTGYSFSRWTSSDVRLSTPYSKKVTFTMPAYDVVIKANWNRAGFIIPSLPDVSDNTTPNWLNLDDHDAYIQGYPNGTVRPQNNITRAEVATIFFRLLTDEAREYFWSTDSGFSDVKSSDWYNTAVSTMVNAGILTGYNDGTFRPNDPITRAEFATIAARFLSDPYSLQDRFYDTEGHWAEVYINRAAEVGWINGYSDGTFRPDRAITRAEAVTLVNNVLGRKPNADYMLDNMITWPDNPKSAWYYEAIQEATNSHDYRWSSQNYEIWTRLS